MAYTSRLFPTISARGPSQGSAAEAEAPSENEVFARRLGGECGLYLATVSHDFGTGPVTGQCRGGPRRQAKTRYFQGAWRASVAYTSRLFPTISARAVTGQCRGGPRRQAKTRYFQGAWRASVAYTSRLFPTISAGRSLKGVRETEAPRRQGARRVLKDRG